MKPLTPTLTPKQLQVLQFVADQLASVGRAPTIREITRSMGVSSTCTAQRRVDALVRKGCLTRAEYEVRSLDLTPFGRSLITPVVVGCCPTCQRPYGTGEAA